MKIPHRSRLFGECVPAALALLAATLVPVSAATFTVLTTNDSGAGSLRQAIADAAASPGPGTIQFAAALDGQTITLSSELIINDASGSVTVDGRSGCATPNGVTISGGLAVRILTVQAGSTATLRYLTLFGGDTIGSPFAEGGGIRNFGTVGLCDCTIVGCWAEVAGGGLANLSGAAATLERCTVSNCWSLGEGGGIYTAGTCTLRNTTVSSNHAVAGAGGGVIVSGGESVRLAVESCTIASNNAITGGGISLAGTPGVRLENSIVGDNFGHSWPDLSGLVTTAGRNLVEDPSGATGLGAGDLVGIDPQLEALADNGGPTRTHLPGTGSPVIDAGIPTTSTPASDQRFLAREADNGDDDGDGEILDIGAVELGEPGALGGAGQVSLAKPTEGAGQAGTNHRFGTSVVVLPNGNFVVTDPAYAVADPMNVANAGAVYLYDGATLEVISILTGSSADDFVGSGGVTVLAGGNYVVSSPDWDNGGAAEAGAVTWGNGTTGVSGVVSAANSLVGSSTFDRVGNDAVTPLSNGNYVVCCPSWDDVGGRTEVGAVTWGDGATGVSGVISAANSLVGRGKDDSVGSGGVTALANGNYVVCSPLFGGPANVGAVSWGDGTVGIAGEVSSANSLVGGRALDQIGSGGVTELANGNYVVRSPFRDDGGTADVGAVTWGDGTAGVSGTVTAANSLVGSSAFDYVGIGGVYTLASGNYVVSSPDWTNLVTTAGDAGAVTWGDGTAGVAGAVSAANSLVGSSAGDRVGSVTALSNGHYVVRSPQWDNGGMVDAGAVTWGDGTTGATGTVDGANSLVGGSANDQVGSEGATALTNGNYVLRSTKWDNGGTVDAGAVTWGDGTSGLVGVVSEANSLVGSSTLDRVGSDGVTTLVNGNYVVSSRWWDNGVVADAGAATWGDGTTGVTGAVSAANSLVGSSGGDQVGEGFFGVTALANGNYVVGSPSWDNGGTPNVGAVTWGDGTLGVTGAVGMANSLVGSGENDFLGGVTALANGNYVVNSSSWDAGTGIDVGSVRWVDGTAGTSGPIAPLNSLVGSSNSDFVGSGGITALANGDYVVNSPGLDNGGISNAGAVTLGDGRLGTTGIITTGNSVLGGAENGGAALVFDYDAFHSHLLVGDSFGNRVTVFSNVPEIVVERPAGVTLPNCGMAVFGAPVGAVASRTFLIRNDNLADLTGLHLTIDGLDAGYFALEALPSAPLGAFQSSSFTVRFAPTSPGTKTAVLHIGSNDPDEHPFDIVLSGRVLVPAEDTDGDGLNDVSEFKLASLGFDWATTQPELVAEMFGNLGDALPNLNAEGYFTTAQVQELYLDTPLIEGDLTAGTATLTMWVEKSENMVDFFLFPMSDPQTTINGLGQLEFEFPLENGAAFFRLGTSDE